jgi:hypothetical protein
VWLASYAQKDWAFLYLRAKDDAEIGLIIDRPSLPTAWIEIKSTVEVAQLVANELARIARAQHTLCSRWFQRRGLARVRVRPGRSGAACGQGVTSGPEAKLRA